MIHRSKHPESKGSVIDLSQGRYGVVSVKRTDRHEFEMDIERLNLLIGKDCPNCQIDVWCGECHCGNIFVRMINNEN